MPAVLQGDEEIRTWLDYGEFPLDSAVKLIRPRGEVTCHPVSQAVNKAQTEGPECVKKIDLK